MKTKSLILICAIMLLIVPNAHALVENTMLINGNLYYQNYDLEGEGWSWDAIDKILYLDNYTGTYIHAVGDLKIVVKSDSKILKVDDEYGIEAKNLQIESISEDTTLTLETVNGISAVKSITSNNLKYFFAYDSPLNMFHTEYIESSVAINNSKFNSIDSKDARFITASHIYLDNVYCESFNGEILFYATNLFIGDVEINNSYIKAYSNTVNLIGQDLTINDSTVLLGGTTYWREIGHVTIDDNMDAYYSPDGYNYRPYNLESVYYKFVSFVKKDSPVQTFYDVIHSTPNTGDNLLPMLILMSISLITIGSVTFYVIKRKNEQS